jgi:hypothetical protein
MMMSNLGLTQETFSSKEFIISFVLTWCILRLAGMKAKLF